MPYIEFFDPFDRQIEELVGDHGQISAVEVVTAENELRFSFKNSVKHEDTLTVRLISDIAPEVHRTNSNSSTLHSVEVKPGEFPGTWEFRVRNHSSKPKVIIRLRGGLVRLIVASSADRLELAPTLEKGPHQWAIYFNILLFLAIFFSILVWVIYSESLLPFQKFLAVLGTSFTGAIAFLGLKVTRSSILPETIFLTSFAHAKTSISVLLMANVALIYFAVPPLSCYWHQYEYQRSIDAAIAATEVPRKIAHAKGAMLLFPERPEAYVILSKAVDELRYSDRRLLRKFATEFVDPQKPHIRAVAKFLKSDGECECTDYGIEATQSLKRQIIGWTIFREAEAADYPKSPMEDGLWITGVLPRNLLDSATYKLREAVWAHESLSYQGARFAHIAAGLENQGAPDYPELMGEILPRVSTLRRSLFGSVPGLPDEEGLRSEHPNTYEVQLAFDTLFQHHLLICEFDRAAYYLSEILLQRQRSRDSGALWWDGPEKLSALRFVRSIRASEPMHKTFLLLPTFNLRSEYRVCPNWEQDVEQIQKDLLSDFPNWLEPDEREWREGTVEGLAWASINELVKNSVNDGWRY